MRLLLDARYTRVGRHDGISRYGASLAEAVAGIAAGTPGLDVALLVSDPRQLALLPEHAIYPLPILLS